MGGVGMIARETPIKAGRSGIPAKGGVDTYDGTCARYMPEDFGTSDEGGLHPLSRHGW